MLLRTISLLSLTSLAIAGCSSSSSSSAACTPNSESVTFIAKDKSLLMNGTIDCSTPTRLQTALDNNAVTEIVMQNVPGSMDDDSNLKASRLLRSRGSINTRVEDNGMIASGGVDFFIAGIQRSVGAGARVAVHSWAEADGTQGITVYNRDPNHADHQKYIKYYQDMGFTAANAKDFYVYTLKVAPAEGTHCMSAAELKKYSVVTNGQLDGSVTLSPKTSDGKSVCTH